MKSFEWNGNNGTDFEQILFLPPPLALGHLFLLLSNLSSKKIV